MTLQYTLIIAFDPASAMGWAVYRLQGGILTRVASGVLKTKGPWGGRFLAAQAHVQSLIQAHVLPHDRVWIAYEDVGVRALKSWDNYRVVTGITSAIYAGSAAEGVTEEYIAPININSNKKHFTGKGKADKSEMVEAFKTRFGVDPSDDNEADAAACGLLLSALLDGKVPLPKGRAWVRLIAQHTAAETPKVRKRAKKTKVKRKKTK